MFIDVMCSSHSFYTYKTAEIVTLF